MGSAQFDAVTSVEQVEAIIGEPAPMILMKQLDHLDDGSRSILENSPLAGFGFRYDDNVSQTTTFVGGHPGFFEVESPRRFSFPYSDDRRRPAQNAGVSFVFFLPGIGETLRLNGSAAGWTDGRLTVLVEEAYVHCARCILRSGLWRGVVPSDVRTAPTSIGTQSATAEFMGNPAMAEFLGDSPFLVISTFDGGGGSDTSPRGDEAGFVRVLDERTLAIPDRRGNQRADTFHNLLSDERVSLAAIVPGRTDVLHVEGTGFMTNDPSVLADMALGGVLPQAALIVKVQAAELADNSALAHARVWDPSAHIDKARVPDLMALGAKHMTRAKSDAMSGAPSPVLLKGLAAFPGLVRLMVDIGYRMQLKKEGYGRGFGASRSSTASSGRGRHRSKAMMWSLMQRRSRTQASTLRGSILPAHEVMVVDVIRETEQAVTLVLEKVAREPFDFKPGQYFTLMVDIDGRAVRRAYSATSTPGSTQLALTVKRVPDGRCSIYLNDHVKTGDRLQVLGPSGTFHVARPIPAGREFVLLAAGSGITPIMSIMRSLLSEPAENRIILLYGNRAEADIIYADEIAALRDRHPNRLTVRHFLTRPSATWTGGCGRLDEAAVHSEVMAASPSEHAHYYLCGPEKMMAAATKTLRQLGVAADRVHLERFVSRADQTTLSANEAQPMTVHVRGSQIGAADVLSGSTLLDAGLSAGLPLPYSCTIGNCGECMVRLRKGDVAMAAPNCLTAEQAEQGYILTCVGQPRSPVAIEIDDGER